MNRPLPPLLPRTTAFALMLAAGCLALPATARAVTINMVPVGNAGNAADTTTYGAVAYAYQIGKYDVTIGQYAAFLNAVAATDTYSLYNLNMATNLAIAGISRAGASGSYTYSVINNGGDSSNRPITYVSWFDAARFANWMANGQPTGIQTGTTTENGAYNVNGATTGSAPPKNATNPSTGLAPTFSIPTENEWYKAAYFSPNYGGVGVAGYYDYATQSDTAPGNVVGSGTNQANYQNGVFSVTQSASFSASQNYLTDVGAFSSSGSFYGTFDQSGDVYQWNDLNGVTGSSRGRRGGFWDNDGGSTSVSSSNGQAIATTTEGRSTGFRLAAPVAVPEPSTWVMAGVGIACAGWQGFRRRKRAAG
ncbi:MAG: SUMF1/EgtB/PvdO family nonheme iron enzyme [Pirellulales bacterium]